MANRRDEWLKRRSQFNHGWLKHQILGKLGKLPNVFAGRVEDGDFEASVIHLLVTGWPSRRADAIELIESFQKDCAPSLFLEEPPLSRLNGNSKAWISGLIDTLWRTRYRVGELLQRAQAELGEVDRQVREFETGLLDGGIQPLPETIPVTLRPKLRDVQTSFKNLASVFEEFPKVVQII